MVDTHPDISPARTPGFPAPAYPTAASEWTCADAILAVSEHRDRDAFVWLFQHYAPRVKAYHMRSGLPLEVAEELAQETLLTIWRKAAMYDPRRASPSAWVITIARNRKIDFLRRERHPDEFTVAPPGPGPSTPEDDLDVAEGEQRVRQALDELPAEQAEVLRMAFFEGQSHSQIAGQLVVPLGTVKSRIRRASARLRDLLDGDR